MSLALSTVIYEWRRYLAAVVALAFSGLLVLAEIGMFSGIVQSVTANIDRSPADLMVLPPKAESLLNSGGMPRRVMPMLYMNPEVVDVADLDEGGGNFSNLASGKLKKRSFVQVLSVDTKAGSLTMPVDYPEDVRLALSAPYSVAIDKTALAQLGVKLGDQASLNGHAVRVAAVLSGYPNINQPQVVVSRATLRLLRQSRPNTRVGPMFVRLRDPARAAMVRDQLNAVSNGQYRAWTKAELGVANRNELMKEQVIGIFLTFSLVLGAFIGVVITWQTLRGAILANIKEFASLRALGVSLGSLRLIVVEISFWVGVAGLVATAVLVWGVASLAEMGHVPMAFPASWIVGTGAFLLIIAVVSGLLSLGILKKSQPADLLR